MIDPVSNDRKAADYMELATLLRRAISYEKIPVRKWEMERVLMHTERYVKMVAQAARIETK